jgi:hypothetical protein
MTFSFGQKTTIAYARDQAAASKAAQKQAQQIWGELPKPTGMSKTQALPNGQGLY